MLFVISYVFLIVFVYEVSQASSCNQKVFDAIFLELTRDRFGANLNNLKLINERISLDNQLQERDSSLETLRELCNGQKSNWEEK